MLVTKRDENGKLDSYAWPGGYPLYYVCADGGVLCPDCANTDGHIGGELTDAECSVVKPNDCAAPDWHIVYVDTNWEETDLICDHCGKSIEAAYAD